MTTVTPRNTAAPTQPKAQSATTTQDPAASSPAHVEPAARHTPDYGNDVMESRGVRAPAQRAPTGQQVAERFYDAFVNRRTDEMEQLYAPDVKFKDAIFEYSDRAGTMNMWRKILAGQDSTFVYEFDRMEGDVAVGKWVADYKLFGRPIHNEIESRLTVKDGKITRHEDSFPMDRWARQALPIGMLAEVPLVQWGIRKVLRGFINR